MTIRDGITGGDRDDGRRRAGLGAFGDGSSARADEGPARDGRVTWYLAVGLAGFIVLWALANLVFEWASFAVDLSGGAKQGASTANLIAKLFGTLVVLLLAADPERQRLRWLAGGFLA